MADDNQQHEDSGSSSTSTSSTPNPTPSPAPPSQQPTQPARTLEQVEAELVLERRRYDGLQGNFNNQTRELVDAKAKTEAEYNQRRALEDTQGTELTTLKTQSTEMRTAHDTLTENLVQAQAETARMQAEAQVQRMLLTPEYQGLIPLFASGSISTQDADGKPLDDAALKVRLDGLLETLGTMNAAGQQQQASGSRPPAGGEPPPSTTAAQLRTKLLSGSLKANSDEYNTALTEYSELLKQEGVIAMPPGWLPPTR